MSKYDENNGLPEEIDLTTINSDNLDKNEMVRESHDNDNDHQKQDQQPLTDKSTNHVHNRSCPNDCCTSPSNDWLWWLVICNWSNSSNQDINCCDGCHGCHDHNCDCGSCDCGSCDCGGCDCNCDC